MHVGCLAGLLVRAAACEEACRGAAVPAVERVMCSGMRSQRCRGLWSVFIVLLLPPPFSGSSWLFMCMVFANNEPWSVVLPGGQERGLCTYYRGSWATLPTRF